MPENKSKTGSDWYAEIVAAEKEFNTYYDRCRKIIRRYRDDDRSVAYTSRSKTRFNILWSVMQTLGPAIYARLPKPEVERRYKDNDPIGRVASIVLERATTTATTAYDFDCVLRQIRDDYLLLSRGIGWVRYVPYFQDEENIPYEEVVCDHVYYKDFLHSTARVWREVRWCGRWIYLSRKQLLERFGNKLGKEIPLDWTGKDSKNYEERNDIGDTEAGRRARIFELWDSDSMTVNWISKAYDTKLLDVQSDPLGLHNFFPTPRPLYGTMTNDSLIPIPDYCQYQDLANLLDEITIQEGLLIETLRVAGIYDASVGELTKLINGSSTNLLVPVQNWPVVQQAGGLKGVIDILPIDMIAATLIQLYEAKKQIKADLYEITGIADIIRGNSSPTETATAQQIKGQFATLRLSDRQRAMQTYAKELIALKAEIIGEHFAPETIAAMSGADVANPDIAMMFNQAIGLLRNDMMRSFRIDIETDSTIAIDDTLEKQSRVEFLQAFGQFLEGVLKTAQMVPALTPMLGEAMLFLVRGYHGGRSLESSIEQAMGLLNQQAQQAMSQPPPPNPDMVKAQTEAQKAQMEMQSKQQEMAFNQQQAQMKLQFDTAKAQEELQLKQAELMAEVEASQRQAELEMNKLVADVALKTKEIMADMELRGRELASKEIIETQKIIEKKAKEDREASTFQNASAIKKTGSFSFDPTTGDRKVEIVETPIFSGEQP